MTPLAPILTQVTEEEVVDVCGDDPGWVCRQVLERWDNDLAARGAEFLVARPLRILLIVVVAVIANRILRRVIRRFTEHIADPTPSAFKRSVPAALVATTEVNLRATARAQALNTVLRSIATVVVWTIAAFAILGELNIQLGPLIAGAGIAGIALGFGAQSLVKDFLAGIFMLVEDQYGVGDVVDVGEATGVVEAVSLRSTRLRSVNGTVWHVPNGEIRRVGNMSQQWSRALLDVEVAYGTDVVHASAVIQRVADEMHAEPEWRSKILDPPEIWGVENLGPDGVAIRLVVRTLPGEQWALMRQLRARLKLAFDAEGIEIPFPQRTVWFRPDPDRPEPPADAESAAAPAAPAGPPPPAGPAGPVGPIHHLALAEHWAAALESGEYRRSTVDRSLEDEGFVHCSFPEQVRGTADRYYAGRDDVVLLTVDPARLGAAELRVEDLSGRGEAFPHVYGPIPVAAVIEATPLPLDDDGRLVLP